MEVMSDESVVLLFDVALALALVSFRLVSFCLLAAPPPRAIKWVS